jgi:hypothetical protein
VIDKEGFRDFRYYLTMVQLQNCLAIAATRTNPDDTPQGEMAGVYVFSIPVNPPTPLFGFLRHVNMAGRQCLSPCVLSMGPIADTALDREWQAGSGGGKVERNFAAFDDDASAVPHRQQGPTAA